MSSVEAGFTAVVGRDEAVCDRSGEFGCGCGVCEGFTGRCLEDFYVRGSRGGGGGRLLSDETYEWGREEVAVGKSAGVVFIGSDLYYELYVDCYLSGRIYQSFLSLYE